MCKMALENKRFIALHEIQIEKLQAVPAPPCAVSHNQLIQ